MENYLSVLNPEQRQAVLHWGKPLLILAGAGSGKTRVITTKIAYLVRERGVDPRSILAVTFTNKAAREMAERAQLIDSRAAEAMIRTFHSFGAWFLRRNGALIGLDSNFVIYDDDDTVTLLSSIMPNTTRAEAAKVAHHIARAKDYFLTPDDPELALIDHRPQFRNIYKLYEERLKAIGNVDFGDLIKKPVEILRAFPEVRQRFQDRFQVILVDEYQDSNVAQFELLKELYTSQTYLCVVGDDDQSIYRFRGAEVRNILEFPDRFSETDIIRLERNYRSTAPILAVAGAVVDNNQGRLGKTLQAERGNGKLPTLVFLPDQETEASFCAELIEKSLRSRGGTYSDWAILYRTNAQSLTFETELLRRHIPYKVVGSLKFYEREEIKDALALLSIMVNPRDEIAFKRVINKPARGLGQVTIDKIIEAASHAEPASRGNLLESCRNILPELSKKARNGLEGFLRILAQSRSMITTEGDVCKNSSVASDRLTAGDGLSALIVYILEASGIAEYHATEDEIAGTQRLSNLQELANAASLYPATEEGLAEFLEHIELDRSLESGEESNDSVTLITVHNTKGLEFRKVIITGLEQGIFPRDDKQDEDLEEERRLFYVGVTRAKDELYLTTCALRRMYGRASYNQPSLFLSEIPLDYIKILGQIPRGFKSGPKSASICDPSLHGAGQRDAEDGRLGPYARQLPRAPRTVSSDGLWRIGASLFHDDYGYGQVVRISEGPEGPLIEAQFETGKQVRFLSKYQSERFMRIERDGY
ncbi:ATP-dependent helicase [Gracilinema caldarium]|uniref:DNA 3'-5' helicase n=1 Tax=Gracilinema caldarium (strain ATCC 51460 / DSM 7334 / H1) TaxID=744872 RepID=F8EYQ0_GRAC1|nr:UvrD-helicase domain-containing protein [Gracilinema caldarium]AEJ18627.1 UvrD/REP helicase [Gracilinema caldarium DSM 7334]